MHAGENLGGGGIRYEDENSPTKMPGKMKRRQNVSRLAVKERPTWRGRSASPRRTREEKLRGS